jgi:hypothetical protein
VAVGLLATIAAADTLTISGFSTPESVVHDTIQDVYFVSNIGPGNPGALDHNGFISRVNPNGTIIQLAWITGLNGPKGLWLFRGNSFPESVWATALPQRRRRR